MANSPKKQKKQEDLSSATTWPTRIAKTAAWDTQMRKNPHSSMWDLNLLNLLLHRHSASLQPRIPRKKTSENSWGKSSIEKKRSKNTHTHTQTSTSTKRVKKRECRIMFLRRRDGRLSLDYRCRFAQKEPKKDTSKSNVSCRGTRTTKLTNKLEAHVRDKRGFLRIFTCNFLKPYICMWRPFWLLSPDSHPSRLVCSFFPGLLGEPQFASVVISGSFF